MYPNICGYKADRCANDCPYLTVYTGACSQYPEENGADHIKETLNSIKNCPSPEYVFVFRRRERCLSDYGRTHYDFIMNKFSRNKGNVDSIVKNVYDFYLDKERAEIRSTIIAKLLKATELYQDQSGMPIGLGSEPWLHALQFQLGMVARTKVPGNMVSHRGREKSLLEVEMLRLGAMVITFLEAGEYENLDGKLRERDKQKR